MLDVKLDILSGKVFRSNAQIHPTITTLYRAYNTIPNLKLKTKPIKHWWQLIVPNKFMRTDYLGRYEIKMNNPKDGWWFNFYVLL